MRMIRLRTKLTLFNLLSKTAFAVVVIGLLPFVVKRINTIQTDLELIEKREKTIRIIEEAGIEAFITPDNENTFGSYNILKDEFISLERDTVSEELNYIEISSRLIEDETIDYRVLNYTIYIDDLNYLLQIGKSTETISKTEETTWSVIFVFLIFFIVSTLLLDLFYSKRILKPLEQIVEKIKSASSPLKYSREPVKTTTYDFIQLDQTIKDLMEKIVTLFRKEKEITVDISHELLTPVSITRSKLENLLLSSKLDIEAAEKIEESLHTINRLTTLVNSMLLIARIESHQYLKEDSFSLNAVLSEAIDEISPVAENNDIHINYTLKEDHIISQGNRSLLFSMFFNILSNAVKNSNTGDEIAVSCYRKEKNHLVRIKDNGKGMTNDQLKTLFSRFSTKYKRDGEGTGIGLAITKSIADFHNIDIKVTSETGQGTTFLLVFHKNS